MDINVEFILFRLFLLISLNHSPDNVFYSFMVFFSYENIIIQFCISNNLKHLQNCFFHKNSGILTGVLCLHALIFNRAFTKKTNTFDWVYGSITFCSLFISISSAGPSLIGQPPIRLRVVEQNKWKRSLYITMVQRVL